VDERAIVERAQSGDVDAFGRLLREHQPAALRLAYAITGHAGDAEDAAQEGFVNAWRALASFDLDRPFRPWLLKIVANEARARRRWSGRRRRLHSRLAESAVARKHRAESPEGMVIDGQMVERILEEIERLPEVDQIALKLRYFAGMSTAEIAESLDEPAGTTRSRLSRATRKLRERVTAERDQASSQASVWRKPANEHEPT